MWGSTITQSNCLPSSCFYNSAQLSCNRYSLQKVYLGYPLAFVCTLLPGQLCSFGVTDYCCGCSVCMDGLWCYGGMVQILVISQVGCSLRWRAVQRGLLCSPKRSMFLRLVSSRCLVILAMRWVHLQTKRPIPATALVRGFMSTINNNNADYNYKQSGIQCAILYHIDYTTQRDNPQSIQDMITRQQRRTTRTIETHSSNSNSSDTLSSCPPPAHSGREQQSKCNYLYDYSMLQNIEQDSGQVKQSLEEAHNSFIQSMAERKASLQLSGHPPKLDSSPASEKQVLRVRHSSIVAVDAKQQLQQVASRQKEDKNVGQMGQHTQQIKVSLHQQTQSQESSYLGVEQQKGEIQYCAWSLSQTEQKNESVEVVNKQTYHRSLHASPKEKHEIQLKLKILQPYLRATIQVLSGKFPTLKSIELEYLWDLDHHRVWLTRQQAKQKALALYMGRCTADTQTFFSLNGVQMDSLEFTPLLLNRVKKIFTKILLQKIRIFEVVRKKVMEEIRASKAKVISQRIPTPTKPWSKKKGIRQLAENEPMTALEETIRLTQKYFMKNNSKGSVVNIIVPSFSIVERSTTQKDARGDSQGIDSSSERVKLQREYGYGESAVHQYPE